MDIEKITEIFSMSGYGVYVWSAFSVTLCAFISLFLFCRNRLKKALAEKQQLSPEKNNEAC